MGLLSGVSKLLGGGSSSKSSTKPATVWDKQAPYLQDLYSQAQGMYRGMSGYSEPVFDKAGYDAAMAAYQKAQNSGYPGSSKISWPGGNYWNSLRGIQGPGGRSGYTQAGPMPTIEQFMRPGVPGSSNPLSDNFRNITGLAQNTWKGLMSGSDPYSQGLAKNAMDQLLAGPQNPYLTGMANAAMNNIGQNFQSQIMPALLGGGNAAGQLGGGRYALLQNQAASDAMKAMGDVGNQIYGNAWNSGLQSMQGALGMVGDVWAQNLQARQNALGMTGDIAGMPFLPLQQYANILGRPTVLSGGGSSSSDQSGGLLSGVSLGFTKAL